MKHKNTISSRILFYLPLFLVCGVVFTFIASLGIAPYVIAAGALR